MVKYIKNLSKSNSSNKVNLINSFYENDNENKKEDKNILNGFIYNFNNFTINVDSNNKFLYDSDNILLYKGVSKVNYKNNLYINKKIFSEDLYSLYKSKFYNNIKLFDSSDIIRKKRINCCLFSKRIKK